MKITTLKAVVTAVPEGVTFEQRDDLAQRLIARGFAVEAKKKAKKEGQQPPEGGEGEGGQP